jgi:alkyl sulfatase BDS1-like metallo-beta-lactamase superfamily hydrolase
LNGDRAQGKKIAINWNFTDLGEQYVLNLDHSALTYLAHTQSAQADLTVTLERATLDAITMKQTTFQNAALAGNVKLEGNRAKLLELFGLFDNFDPNFPIVEPRAN